MTDPLDPRGLEAASNRFRKKPVVVEAMRWSGAWQDASVIAAVHAFAGQVLVHPMTGVLTIPTLEGTMTASPGDWLIRGVKGELYPCKPDIFEATYEPAERLAASRENASPSEHRCVRIERADLWLTLVCSCGDEITAGADEAVFDAFAEHALAASPRRENASAPLRADLEFMRNGIEEFVRPFRQVGIPGDHDYVVTPTKREGQDALVMLARVSSALARLIERTPTAPSEQNASVHALVEKWRTTARENRVDPAAYQQHQTQRAAKWLNARQDLLDACADELERALASER